MLLCALAAACVAAGSAQASSRVQYGIQDDTWLEFGPGSLDQRLATFKRLGVPLVRFTLRWNEVALRRPKQPPRRPIAPTTGTGRTGSCAAFAATG